MKDFCLWVRSPEGQVYGTTGSEILRHGTRTTVHLLGLEFELLVIPDPPTMKQRVAALLSKCKPVRAIR